MAAIGRPSVAVPTTLAKTGLVVYGIPQSGRMLVKPDGGQRPKIINSNGLYLTGSLKRALAKQGHELWLPTDEVAGVPRVRWIVNMMADPDEFETALAQLSALTGEGRVPVFNPPGRVMATRRDRVSDLLQGIEGLEAPRCVRFEPARPEDFRAVFDDHEFRYPVLVRPAASQTGEGLVRIEGPDDWDRIFQVPWMGAAVYMTQFVDFRDAGGRYAKARIVLAGGKASVRHILYSDSWMIHAASRTKQDVARKLPLLKSVADWRALQDVAGEVDRRLGLDFFGIDVGVRGPEDFVLFEANAAMSILSYHLFPTIRRNDFVKNMVGIERDVVAAFAAKGLDTRGVSTGKP